MQPGDIVASKYQIETVIGQGASSIVYRAQDLDLGQSVALKMLRPELMRQAAYRQRFLREAWLSAYFVHPNATVVRDMGEWDETIFLVLAYHEGQTLDNLLARKKLELSQVAQLTAQLCACLEAAHRQGIVHSDIKPANLLVVERPAGAVSLQILDFGLASLIQEERQTTAGTPLYMAPEAICSPKPNPAGDLYAAAICVYEMVTGVYPFRDTGPTAQFQRQLPSVSRYRPQISKSLDRVLARALASDPQNRYPDAHALQEALLTALQAKTRPSWIATAVVALVVTVLLALGYGFYRRDQPQTHAREPLAELIQDYRAFLDTDRQIGELVSQRQFEQALRLAQKFSGPEGLQHIVERQSERLKLYPALIKIADALQNQDAQQALLEWQRIEKQIPPAMAAGMQTLWHEQRQVVAYQNACNKQNYLEAMEIAASRGNNGRWPERLAQAQAALQQFLPQLNQILTPSPGSFWPHRKIMVTGKATNPFYLPGLRVNGLTVQPQAQGKWQLELEFAEGAHELLFIYRYQNYEFVISRVRVTIDTTPPVITLVRMIPLADQKRLLLQGSLEDHSGAWLADSGKPVVATHAPGKLYWDYSLPLATLPEKIVLEAGDWAGNLSQLVVPIIKDLSPPEIVVQRPLPQTVVYSPSIQVSGTLADRSSIVALDVAGIAVAIKVAWQVAVPLDKLLANSATRTSEEVVIPITAVDAWGNRAQVQLPVRSRYFYWKELQVQATLRAHGGKVWGLVFSPQGDFLCSGGNDQKISVWETRKWVELVSWPGYFATSYDFGITPAIYFVSTNLEQASNIAKEKFYPRLETAGIWQISATTLRGSPYAFIDKFIEPQVRCLALSHDKTRLALADRHGFIKLVFLDEDQQPGITFKAHQGGILALAFSGQGHLLASAGGEALVKLWDGRTGKPMFTCDGHTMPITTLAFGEEDNVLASGSRDKKICVWETLNGSLMAVKSGGHTSSITALSFMPGKPILVSGDYDGKLVVWGKK